MTTSRCTGPAVSGGDAAAVVQRYLEVFLSGDIDAAQRLVRRDFRFRAPLIEVGSRDTWFAGAEAKMRYIRGFRVLRQWHEGADVSTLYELDVRTAAGSAHLLVHEWHTVEDGQLASSVMLFDTSARAAQLLHDALVCAEC